MSHQFDDILEDPDARAELEGVARLLESERPLPRPAFRGELGRSMRAGAAPNGARRLRLRIVGLAAAGVLLLASAGLGVADVGPLAPSRSAAVPAVITAP